MTDEITFFETSDSAVQMQVIVKNDTVWLSLDQMTQLFDRNKSTVSRHIKNVFERGELQKSQLLQICNSSNWRRKRSFKRDWILQSRRNHFSRLQGQIAEGNRIQAVGKQSTQGLHSQRVLPESEAAWVSQPDCGNRVQNNRAPQQHRDWRNAGSHQFIHQCSRSSG